jgi:hypothetical protein
MPLVAREMQIRMTNTAKLNVYFDVVLAEGASLDRQRRERLLRGGRTKSKVIGHSESPKIYSAT